MQHQFQYLAQATPTIGTPSVSTSQETQSPSSPTAQQQQSPGGGYMQLLFPIILIGVLYFLLIRPQQKKEKEKKNMLKELKKGDKVVTRGGIWGVVTNLHNEKGICALKIADKINIELSISAIEVVNPEPQKADVTK